MSPQEFWAIADARKPPKMIGNFTVSEFKGLAAQLGSDKP